MSRSDFSINCKENKEIFAKTNFIIVHPFLAAMLLRAKQWNAEVKQLLAI